MKKPILSLLITVGLIGSASAEVLFSDNFSGYSVNTNNWVENLYGNSSIYQNNGILTISSDTANPPPSPYTRAVLTTSQGFNQAISVQGTFSLQNTYPNPYLILATRSSGLVGGYYNEPYGLEVQILDRNVYDYLQSAQILYSSTYGETQIASIQGISFDPQAINSYRLDDYGNSVSLYLNGSLILSSDVDASFSQGNQVSFSDNGGGGTSTLGPLSIQSVPEPSTYALFGIGAIGMLMAMRRKKTA